MIKRVEYKKIEIKELDNIPEKRNRVFKIIYTDQVDHIKTEKQFQYKKNLRKCIDNPRTSKVQLFVGDVTREKRV